MEVRELEGADRAPDALRRCDRAENRRIVRTKVVTGRRPVYASGRNENAFPENAMNLTTAHLADILIGIARAQNAVIEAMERASPGFRNTHAVPPITLAANMRAGDPRMIDLPARILMRLQGRVALDNAAVKADLERLMSAKPAAAAAP